MRAHTVLSVIFAPAAAAVAQSADWSEGPTMAVAQGLSVDAATPVPGATAATLLFTKSDFKSSKPVPYTPVPVPGAPNLATVPYVVVPGLDIDGLSIGSDYILADATGHIDVPPGHWGAITFSVTRATVGTAGGLIRGEALGAGGAAADVFAYILPGSVGFPASMIDRPLRSQDSKELSLDATGAPGNIDAQDLYMGLVLQENPQLGFLVPGYPWITVYFSVTTTTAAAVPPAWWGAAPPSGATVLATTWNPTTAVWSTPVPFLTPAALGLGAAEELDALGIDLAHGRVLFSTAQPGLVPRNPILFANLGAPGIHYVYRRPDEVPVSTRLGLGGGPILADDIDGICALDPGPGSQLPLNRFLGSPQNPLPVGALGRLGACAFRRLAQNGLSQELVSYMTGFPVPGNTPPGLAFCGIALGSPTNPYTTVGAFARPNPASPYSQFQGHPEQFVQTVPTSPVFSGLGVFFVWAAFDGVAFDVSLPVGITL